MILSRDAPVGNFTEQLHPVAVSKQPDGEIVISAFRHGREGDVVNDPGGFECGPDRRQRDHPFNLSGGLAGEFDQQPVGFDMQPVEMRFAQQRGDRLQIFPFNKPGQEQRRGNRNRQCAQKHQRRGESPDPRPRGSPVGASGDCHAGVGGYETPAMAATKKVAVRRSPASRLLRNRRRQHSQSPMSRVLICQAR